MGFASSLLLVVVQFSVFSSCRFAHSEKIARNAAIDASTTSVTAIPRRRTFGCSIGAASHTAWRSTMARAGVPMWGAPPHEDTALPVGAEGARPATLVVHVRRAASADARVRTAH